MPNGEKVVRLLQVKVLPQYRDEVLQAVRGDDYSGTYRQWGPDSRVALFRSMTSLWSGDSG